MSYTAYLRWGAVGSLFLALFIPFIVATGSWGVPNLFFPYITGKNFAFRLLVEFALLCYVLLALREPKYRPRGSLIMWATLAFVAWMGIATLLSVDPLKSLWSNFERMEGYVGLVHLFVWFVITGAVLGAQNFWEKFFNWSITLSAAQGFWAVLQAAGVFAISSQSGLRADTTFGNATYLAVYLLVNVFLTLFMIARNKGARNYSTLLSLYGVAIALQIAGLILTETRGAILGLAGGLIISALYILIFARKEAPRVLRNTALGSLIVLAVFGVALYALRNTAFIKEVPGLRRVASISVGETTVESRLKYIWPMALKGFTERPIAGWGQENFNFVFNKYYEPGMYKQEQWFDRAHNQFLDWLIAGGLPAFVLYLSLYVLAVLVIWRQPFSTGERAAFLGLLAGYAFNNLFVFDNLVSGMYFFALLAYFHSLSRRELPGSVWLSKPLSDQALAIAAPIVAGVALLGMWSLNAPGLARAMDLIPAIQTQEAGVNSSGAVVGVAKDPKKNLAEFKSVLAETTWPGTPLGKQEATEQLLQFASNVAPQTNVDPQAKVDLFTSALAAIEDLMKGRPGDARLELFEATLLGQYGQTTQALEHLRKALEYSPHKQQIEIQLGLTLIQANNIEEALRVFKEAYEAAPDFELATVFYAAALDSAKRPAEADALLQQHFGSTVVDNPQLLQAYMNFKLYDRVIAIWKKRTEAAPKDGQAALGLASAYFAACRVPETILQLKKIASIEPAAALDMQNIIKQIQDGTIKCGQ